MQKDKLYHKNGQVVSFNPLQIQQGLADGLTELSEEEIAVLNNPSGEELSTLLRIATEQRLAATDQYGMDDYPDNEKRAEFRAYRTELRMLNHREGAPWDGGGELTPWPVLPEFN